MIKDIIVIYNSQTGFTKRYAQWISETLECEYVERKEAGKLNFEQYGTIIFGGWACTGGINYERMSVPSKLMMKMFISALKAKKDKTEAEKIQLEMISKSYDISDKKYIEPIVDWAKPT